MDRRLELLKIHLPYHESDHNCFALAYLPLCGGAACRTWKAPRQDEVLLDGLGGDASPTPPRRGDFCRRFSPDGIRTLLDIVHDTRLKVWSGQPKGFFEQAILDMDGFLVETTGKCKRGMDIGHDGTWGYHALVLTLANTGEVLSIVNRPGNRPSHEGRDAGRSGHSRVLPRRLSPRPAVGTPSSRSRIAWTVGTTMRVHFLFGFERCRICRPSPTICRPAWRPLRRPARYTVKTTPRQRRTT